MKTCCTCKETKELTAYYKSAKHKQGVQDRCKQCCITLNAAYRKANKDKVLAGVQSWRSRNAEKYAAYMKQYEADHKERLRPIRNCHKRKRKLAIKNSGPQDTDITLDKLFQRDAGICGICNTVCERNIASMDHIQPISKGGLHTWDNVQLAHFNCNAKKGNRTND